MHCTCLTYETTYSHGSTRGSQEQPDVGVVAKLEVGRVKIGTGRKNHPRQHPPKIAPRLLHVLTPPKCIAHVLFRQTFEASCLRNNQTNNE